MTAADLRRRFLALAVLQWLPGATFFPVLVLLMRERGHSVGQIGVMFAVFAAVVLLLELPSGSAADVYGRRRVLLLSAAVTCAACLLLAVAETMVPFTAGLVLVAIGRAAGSGVLESWYVDTLGEADPGAAFEPGLARGRAAGALSLAGGALIGGFFPAVSGSLAGPVWLAAGFAAVLTVAVATVMTGSGRAPASGVGATLRSALRASVRDTLLLRVLLCAFGGGVAATVLEALWPLRAAASTGDPRTSAMAYGVVLCAAFAAGAGGTVAAPTGPRFTRPNGIALFMILVALCYAAMAFVTHIIAFVVLFLAIQWLSAVADLLSALVLHRRATPEQRVTVASVDSLAAQIGGICGSSLLLGAGSYDQFAVWVTTSAAVLLIALAILTRDRAPAAERN
ncbi:MFS transporter [Sphaerisporangium sp. B11E5]|uniref:MFS transporter n=1 Tax=Sphaerisporangium sp. B11E5 TaxID=3153563 RepID=UPI00325E15C3